MIPSIPKQSPTQGLPILSLKELCAIEILSHGLDEEIDVEQKEVLNHQIFRRMWTNLKSNTPAGVLMLESKMSKAEQAWESTVKRKAENNIVDEFDSEPLDLNICDGLEYKTIEELTNNKEAKKRQELLLRASKESDLFRNLTGSMMELFKKAGLNTPILNDRIPMSCIEYTHMQEVLQNEWEDDTLWAFWNYSINPHINDLVVETTDDIRRFMANPANAAYLREIAYLKLKNHQIKAIPPEIAYLSELRTLKLQGNEISDIEHLGKLTKLEHLDLGTNNISNISHLANCTALKTLILEDNLISNIDSLRNLTGLEYLDLEKNRITNLEPISQCLQLNTLLTRGNHISSIVPLFHLRNLEDLQLSGNPLLILANPQINGAPSDEWVEWHENFKGYECTSHFSKFLKLILLVTQDPKIIDAEFQKLTHDDRCHIDSMVCKLLGKFPEGPSQKKAETFLNPKILYADMDLFCRAVALVVMEKLDQLTLKETNKICLEIYCCTFTSPDRWQEEDDRLEMMEKTDMIQWGKEHLFDNIFRLTDTMVDMGHLSKKT